MSTQVNTTELREAVKSGGTGMTAFGIVAILLGVLAMLAPGYTGLSITILLGLLVMAGGIVRILWAFQDTTLGKGLLKFALGALTLACGGALLADPILGSGVLTIVLTAYFVLDGLAEIAVGFGRPGGAWLVFGGVISIALGVMLWSQYPLSGAWAMGTLLGIKLFFVGLILVTGGSAVRKVASA